MTDCFPQIVSISKTNVDGVLEIKLCTDSFQHFTLTIKDNGIVFSKDINLKNTTTLGLKLVDVLTQQLEGDLELNQSQGTEFKIKFREIQT